MMPDPSTWPAAHWWACATCPATGYSDGDPWQALVAHRRDSHPELPCDAGMVALRESGAGASEAR